MQLGEIVCVGGFALAGAGFVSLLVWGIRNQKRERILVAKVLDELLAFAAKQGWEVEDQTALGLVNTTIRATVLDHACNVRLGWNHSDLELTYYVEAPRLVPPDFADCWERSWTRYLKRAYEDRLNATSSQALVRVSGPAHSLRDTFAEVDVQAMAQLFGAPAKGRGGGHPRVSVGPKLIAVTFYPSLSAVEAIEARFEALVRLARFSTRPFGEEPVSLVAPRAVGTAQIQVQEEQRCAYCHEALAGSTPAELKTCAACTSTLHAGCLEEHGGCCTVGCRNNPRGRPDARGHVRA